MPSMYQGRILLLAVLQQLKLLLSLKNKPINGNYVKPVKVHIQTST